MVGDLRVLKDKTSVLEIHPFPEWVVQIFQYGIETGDTFAIVPNFPKKEVDDMRDLPWSLRVEKIEALLNDLELSEYLAVKYQDGVCLKVPANIPHEFIRIADKNENVPYCQVFEPDFKSIGEVFQIQPTMFFEIKETLSITH